MKNLASVLACLFLFFSLIMVFGFLSTEAGAHVAFSTIPAIPEAASAKQSSAFFADTGFFALLGLGVLGLLASRKESQG